jgi:hypothetical protein
MDFPVDIVNQLSSWKTRAVSTSQKVPAGAGDGTETKSQDLCRSIRSRLVQHGLLVDVKYKEVSPPSKDWPFPLRQLIGGWSLVKPSQQDKALFDDILRLKSQQTRTAYETVEMNLFCARFLIQSKLFA